MFYRTYENLSDIPEPFRGKSTHRTTAPEHNKFNGRSENDGVNACGIGAQGKPKNSQDMLFVLLMLMLLME